MTTKQFQILSTIFNKTTNRMFCTLSPKEVSQAKKMYRRVKELHNQDYIDVFRGKGECNLYRITDKGIRYLMNYPTTMNLL
jgi:predicted transcriptional regulator